MYSWHIGYAYKWHNDNGLDVTFESQVHPPDPASVSFAVLRLFHNL